MICFKLLLDYRTAKYICPVSDELHILTRSSTTCKTNEHKLHNFILRKTFCKMLSSCVIVDNTQQETQLSLTNRATHLCKGYGMADLLKTCPSPCVLPCRIWSFCVERCSKNTGKLQNWGYLKLRSLEMGGVADHKIHAPPSHVSPRQIW